MPNAPAQFFGTMAASLQGDCQAVGCGRSTNEHLLSHSQNPAIVRATLDGGFAYLPWLTSEGTRHTFADGARRIT